MEGLPDELGPEWRVLHPFEILGVRFPTDDTPPNHRRLAESDALVELIQMAEYIEDAPSWGQRRLYPPRYGSLSIGDEAEVMVKEEEGEGIG